MPFKGTCFATFETCYTSWIIKHVAINSYLSSLRINQQSSGEHSCDNRLYCCSTLIFTAPALQTCTIFSLYIFLPRYVVLIHWVKLTRCFGLLCQEELASAASELEETNYKLAALKAQRDNTQGARIPYPTLGNKSMPEDKVRDKQREMQDLEATHKELSVTAIVHF